MAAGEFLRQHHRVLFRDDRLRKRFNTELFNGFDFDPTMLRIGAMNVALHGRNGAASMAAEGIGEVPGACEKRVKNPNGPSCFFSLQGITEGCRAPMANR